MIEPYLALWAAALQVAVEDIQSDRDDRDTRESAAWVMDNSNSPRSFLWVCDILGADPRRVREVCRIDSTVNLPDTAPT